MIDRFLLHLSGGFVLTSAKRRVRTWLLFAWFGPYVPCPFPLFPYLLYSRSCTLLPKKKRIGVSFEVAPLRFCLLTTIWLTQIGCLHLFGWVYSIFIAFSFLLLSRFLYSSSTPPFLFALSLHPFFVIFPFLSSCVHVEPSIDRSMHKVYQMIDCLIDWLIEWAKEWMGVDVGGWLWMREVVVNVEYCSPRRPPLDCFLMDRHANDAGRGRSEISFSAFPLQKKRIIFVPVIETVSGRCECNLNTGTWI